MSTGRASRPSREKHSKTAFTDKKDDNQSNKVQPTAEQLQIANMINMDTTKEDPEVLAKIAQVRELTGASEDDALFALYDVNYDLNRAVEKVLESCENTKNEWHTISKKEKNPAPPKQDPVISNSLKTDIKRDKSREPDSVDKNDNSGLRNRRERGPPRFQRGRGRDRGGFEDERSRPDNQSGDRNFDRSDRGGRGRGRGGFPARGRGRGRPDRPSDRQDRVFRDARFDSNKDQGPHIDTWTNAQAETKAEKENIGSWGEMAEDWTTEEWQGSLDESQVFTAKSASDSNQHVNNHSGVHGSSIFPDNDAKLFSAPVSVESQVFTASLNNSSSPTNTFSHGGASLQQSMAPGTIGQNTLGQRIDMSALFPKTTENSSLISQPQNQYMSQYAKEATESIKNAVGIGSPSAGQPGPVGLSSDGARSMGPSAVQNANQVAQQRPSNKGMQRSKLPPPSKIPASAVEMPGGMNVQLDVQFGNWDLGSDSNSNSLGFGTVNSSGTPNQYAASASSVLTTAAPTKTQYTAMPSQVGHSQVSKSPHIQNTGYKTTTTATPSRDNSQSSTVQNATITTPDSMSFPAATNERKTSPYSAQRSAQAPVTSTTAYSQSNYTSSYGSSAYKPVLTTVASYQQSSNGLQSVGLSHASSSQYSSGGNYQSTAFQNQGGYTSNPSQSSLYQNASAQSAGFSAQSGGSSYSSGTGSSYQSPNSYPSHSNSAYQSQSYARDSSQSGSSAYPSVGVSQSSATAYQSSGVSQSGSSAYQSGSVSQSNSMYQSAVSQASGYPSMVNQSAGSGYAGGAGSQSSYQASLNQAAASSGYPRDDQTSSTNHMGYNHQPYAPQNVHQNSLSSTKLGESMSKISLKDSGLDGQSAYDSSSTAVSLSTTTASSASSSAGANVSQALGLSVSSTSISSTNAMSKSSLPHTSKAPPNLPPGVPILPNYMPMGQPAIPFFANLAAQQPMYSYEDLQLLQQRLPMPGYSYDMPLQPASTLTGREQSATLSQVPYSATGQSDNKLTRVDAQSPVNAQSSQQSAHQQQYINPTQLPPGYNYYYPGSVLPSGYSYPPVFPVSVTNAAHGTTTNSVQFQKGAFGSHTYGAGGQTQDYSKGYGGSSGPSKVSSGSIVSSTSNDLTGTGTNYGKQQSYDKSGYHAGTPPPFNVPMPSGTQAGQMGGPQAYGASYVPVMTHQPHSQLLHHPLQQESNVSSGRSSQQSGPGNKNVNKGFSAYWGSN